MVIGPIFHQNLIYLEEVQNLTFLSLSNKTTTIPRNVITMGINANSQINAIVDFIKKENLNKTIVLVPKSNFEDEFDVILNMEVVEHVLDVNLFIQNCSKLIKKNGIMFVATINKNLKSYMFAILGAEYILRWLPIGTHDWDKFLTPQDLEIIANKNDFRTGEVAGMKFNFFSKKWYKSKDTSVNYISTFMKN